MSFYSLHLKASFLSLGTTLEVLLRNNPIDKMLLKAVYLINKLIKS